VHLVGMIPEDIESVDIDLSETVKGQFDPFIREVVKEIERSGIPVTPIADPKGLETIIDAYANPIAVRC
jgi:hydrogenase maturation protease